MTREHSDMNVMTREKNMICYDISRNIRTRKEAQTTWESRGKEEKEKETQ